MIPETDLIIKNGNIYHLDINSSNISTTIILVGDQDRVSMISKYFDSITHISQHREFVIHSGYYKGKFLTAMSTGIGTDNIDIAVNELDAIFNIDLDTRQIKENLTTLNLIRLGTCGCIDENIPVDSVIVSDYGLGFDNLMSFYTDKFNISNEIVYGRNTYIVGGDEKLREIFSNLPHGITLTFPGFYGPQSRNLRLKNNMEYIFNNLNKLVFKESKVLNIEMETSALYGLAKLTGHKALTLCTVVANRATKQFSNNSELAVDNMIKMFLNKIIKHI